MGFLIVMVLLLVVMYVLMIRPNQQRQREQKSIVEGASVGDDVLTTGGIYGTITRAEGDDLVVEIADGLSVHMTRRGIAAVLPPEEDEEDEDDEEPEVVDAEPELEALVTGDEEDPVTSEAEADGAAAERR